MLKNKTRKQIVNNIEYGIGVIELTDRRKRRIEKVVNKALKEYGKTLRLLGKE